MLWVVDLKMYILKKKSSNYLLLLCLCCCSPRHEKSGFTSFVGLLFCHGFCNGGCWSKEDPYCSLLYLLRVCAFSFFVSSPFLHFFFLCCFFPFSCLLWTLLRRGQSVFSFPPHHHSFSQFFRTNHLPPYLLNHLP